MQDNFIVLKQNRPLKEKKSTTKTDAAHEKIKITQKSRNNRDCQT